MAAPVAAEMHTNAAGSPTALMDDGLPMVIGREKDVLGGGFRRGLSLIGQSEESWCR